MTRGFRCGVQFTIDLPDFLFPKFSASNESARFDRKLPSGVGGGRVRGKSNDESGLLSKCWQVCSKPLLIGCFIAFLGIMSQFS